jgi:uncharacterized protein YcbK (DUF882 family)
MSELYQGVLTGRLERRGSKLKLTAHFSLDEFKCKDGTPVPKKHLVNAKALAMCLERIREVWDKPITIISGYRTESYNKSCGGSENSQHLTASAADIIVPDVHPSEVSLKIKELIDEGLILQGGVGLYPGRFVHYDIRGIAARWEG